MNEEDLVVIDDLSTKLETRNKNWYLPGKGHPDARIQLVLVGLHFALGIVSAGVIPKNKIKNKSEGMLEGRLERALDESVEDERQEDRTEPHRTLASHRLKEALKPPAERKWEGVGRGADLPSSISRLPAHPRKPPE